MYPYCLSGRLTEGDNGMSSVHFSCSNGSNRVHVFPHQCSAGYSSTQNTACPAAGGNSCTEGFGCIATL
ncbi:MAG: hypothetical protein IJ680_05380 [Paludibacteraceae bacterium]|nr:hypothetical protein [Paludibacteraceae bacterium]